jgi:hypothetical protein
MVGDGNAVYPALKTTADYLFQRRITVQRILGVNM